jgi:ATP-dependent DNA ligase
MKIAAGRNVQGLARAAQSKNGWYSSHMLGPTALVLDTTSQPFDDPDWIFEIKHDGFRAPWLCSIAQPDSLSPSRGIGSLDLANWVEL